jgi:MFS family permease
MMTNTSPVGPSSTRNINNPLVQLYLYGIVVFLFWMALNLYLPTLPNYINTRTNDLALIGAIMSMYGLVGTLIRLPLGIAADWHGRCKPFFIAGIVLEGLGAWLMGTAHDTNWLIIGRAISGLAAGTWVVVVVSFSNFFPPEQAVKATAIVTIVPTLGRLAGSFLIGWLNNLGGYPLSFFVSTGFAGLALLIMMMTGEIKHPPRAPTLQSIGKLISRRELLVPSFLNVINQYVVMGAVFGFIPILAEDLGAGNIALGLLGSVYIILYGLGNLTAVMFNQRTTNRTMVIVGIVLMAAGFGLSAAAQSLIWIFIAQACYGLGCGISYPVIMGLCIEKIPINERSTAMGLHQTLYSVGGFAGPWLSGILANAIGVQPMFGVTAFTCLALGILGVCYLSPKKVGGEADS